MLTSWISHLFGRPLRTDEEVMFFPTTARYLTADAVELGVEAWVYEKERRPGIAAVFRRYLRLDPATLTPEENAAFLERVRLFLTDSEGGKLVPITVTTPLTDEPRSLGLPVTPPSGRTSARLNIPAPLQADAEWIAFEARGPSKTFRGRALLVPEEGVSVVSDIDDTIKHTHVLDRREMLLNTFTRPFAAVPGMADLYRRTHGISGTNTRFHYVSGGPHQLWPMIERFLQDEAYPDGSVHMRSINWRVEVFGESMGTLGHKLTTIAGLIRDFPRRRFVLVGDSGERDPEIYGQIAREFPTQVAGVHIRDVTGEPRDGLRYTEAFRGVPAGLWSLFTEPETVDLATAALAELTPLPLSTTPQPGG